MSNEFSGKSKLLLGEIIKGVSKLRSGDKIAYLKHFSIIEQIKLEDFEGDTYEEAIVAGIKCEADLLKRAEEHGIWSQKKEDDIKGSRFIIERTQINLEKTKDINARRILESTLEAANKEVSELEAERSKILNYSAESLASNKKIKRMLEVSLFEDSKCKKRLNKEDLEFFSYAFFNKIGELYSHETMLRVAFEDLFFEVFCYQYRNPLLIFGGEYKKITVYQHRITSYANVLLNKLKNCDIPKNKSKDAVEIFNYKEPEEKQTEIQREGVSDLLAGKKEGESIAISDF